MAARLPRLIALLALVVPGAARAQAAGEAIARVPGSQVIGAETLRRVGALRLSDALVLAHGWDVVTVDGFRWSASPLGGSPFHPARWTVLVDGGRVNEGLFGIADLDRLGITLEQVASVELVELPRLVAGSITTDGLIHIRTTTPRQGPSASGWFATGSEVGDPGPFEFTPAASPNVDRLGHVASAGVAYGGTTWFADATLGWVRMVPTDPGILDRYDAALGPDLRLRTTSPALRIGARLGGGRHEAVFRQARVDGALALSPFGTEIGTTERFTMLGLAGELPALRRTLGYDVSHARDRARRRSGAPGPPLDWESRTTEARLELRRPDDVFELGGVRLRRKAAHAPEGLDDPAIELATAYASVRLGRGTDAPLASGAVTVGEGDVGGAGLLSRRWRLAPRATLEAVLSYERRSRGEDDTIWSWTERGLPLLEEGGADVRVVGSPLAAERSGADVRIATQPWRGGSLSVRGLLRRSRGLSLEHRELHFAPAAATFEGPASVVHGSGGELAGGSVELGASPSANLSLAASYWIRGAIGGDSLYRDAWEAVPRHGARATVEYVPVAGLELWLHAAYRGPTRYVELASVAAESDGRYRDRVDDAFTLDIALQKFLWNGRLRAHFGIRNLFGAELRYHPAGATFAPTATLQVEARLP